MIVKIQVRNMDLRTGPAGREHLVEKDGLQPFQAILSFISQKMHHLKCKIFI